MRRLIVFVCLLLICAGTAQAQRNKKCSDVTLVDITHVEKQKKQRNNAIDEFTNAVGVFSVGVPMGVSYHKDLEKGRLNVDMCVGGLFLDAVCGSSVNYQFVTNRQNPFRAYAGVGLGCKLISDMRFGLNLQLGVEYRFKSPWIISLEAGYFHNFLGDCPHIQQAGIGIRRLF